MSALLDLLRRWWPAAEGAAAEGGAAGRRLAAVSALLGGASVMSQAAADARFLAQLGPVQLALAMAVSSALLALVLAVVGGLSDRSSRGRVLARLAAVAAVALVGFAGLSAIAPRLAAWLGFLGAKQLAAAAELAFWMLAAERLDARQSVRALPRLSAIGGLGGAVSAALAVPLARAGGASAVMIGAAALLAIAAAITAGVPAVQRVTGGAAALPALPALVGRSFRDGAACVVASPLARQLAALVALGGSFAALIYVGLVAAAAGQHTSDDRLAALLSAIRSVAQIATVAAQLVVAPWLLRRLGTGRALLVAPLFALAGAALLTASPTLYAIGVVSVLARALDQAVETPAQKLLHTLLPPASRGRVVGFVEGIAKRSGAIAAGLAGALLLTWPLGFGLAAAASAVAWLWAAGRMARRLPALAVAAPGSVVGFVGSAADAAAGTATHSPALGPRALELLARELTGETLDEGRAMRAAEVLVRLAAEGHAAACGPLVSTAAAQRAPWRWHAVAQALAHTPRARVAPAWKVALLKALDGARVIEGRDSDPDPDSDSDPDPDPATQSASDDVTDALVLMLDALALSGAGASAEKWCEDARPAVAFAAEQAVRWAGDASAAVSAAGDELRHGEPELQAVAVEQSLWYAIRALADRDEALTLVATWPLVTLVRRGLGSGAQRARALGLFAKAVDRLGARRSAETSLLRTELLAVAQRAVEQRGERGSSPGDPTAELVGSVHLLGALLAGGGGERAKLDEISLVVQALADRDEEVAEAAAEAIRRIGVSATAALVVLAGYGHRAARDRAAALLRELPATEAALDQLIERELTALDQTCLALGALTAETADLTGHAALDALLLRRLDERSREIAYTVLLLISARRASPAVGAAAAQWRNARGRYERARALAVLDTTLPRPLAARLLEAIEERPPLLRARAVAQRTGGELPARGAAIGAELRGADALSRRLLLEGLPAASLSAHRDAIAEAAHRLASAADPHRLLRRLAQGAEPGEGADMPSHVETLLALSRVPLFAELSTRQLDELARRARWRAVAAGQLVAARGQPLDALLIVDDAELSAGERRLGPGTTVDDLAWIAPRPPETDVIASRAGRLLAIERSAFEELADDVPGLGASLCRALAERLRGERGSLT